MPPTPGLLRFAALPLAALLYAACAPAPETVGPAGELRPVRVDPGAETSAADAEEARAILEEARSAFGEGRYEDAEEAAGRVVDRYPGTASAGPSLALRARSLAALGRAAEARAALETYLDLLSPGDPRRAHARLVEGRIRTDEGDAPAALDTLLGMPAEAPPALLEAGRRQLRELVPTVDGAVLEEALSKRDASPVASPVLAAWATLLDGRGDPEDAARFARRALSVAPADSPEAAEARALLESIRDRERRRERGAVTLGAFLPLESSPAVQAFAEEVAAGVQAAVAALDEDGDVRLDLEGGEGTAEEVRAALEGLAPEGPLLGIVGPLEEAPLHALADARREPVPVISPTALDTGGREAVYTLSGADPGATGILARYALETGLEQVVVIHPLDREHEAEARDFRETFLELGGSVLRTLPYEVGTTYFEEQLLQAARLAPDALVLPVPAEDIEALAPQVSFFGLDTLGIRVLGTGEWASEEVLRDVAPRHTTGVVTATPESPEESEGYQRFVRGYEEHFERSLTSPVPGLGWDAAGLLIEALSGGAATPAEVTAALEEVEEWPGATGILSVEDGRIVRRHRLLCVQDNELLPVEPGEPVRSFRPERRGDPEEDEPEIVPLGPMQLYCPGVFFPGDTFTPPALDSLERADPDTTAAALRLPGLSRVPHLP